MVVVVEELMVCTDAGAHLESYQLTSRLLTFQSISAVQLRV